MMSLPPQLLQQMLAARAGGSPSPQPFNMRPPILQPMPGQFPQMPQPGFGNPTMPQQMPGPMPFGGQPPISQPMPPQQPGTFNPMPFEGGLGGMPKAGPQLGAGQGLGMGFGKGFFGPRPFLPGDQRVKSY